MENALKSARNWRKHFLTCETEFVLFLAVQETSFSLALHDVTEIGDKMLPATSRVRCERLSCVFCFFLSSGRKNSQQVIFSVYFSGAIQVQTVCTHFKTR